MPSGVFIDGWWYPMHAVRKLPNGAYALKRGGAVVEPEKAPAVDAPPKALDAVPETPKRYATKIVKAGENADDGGKAAGSDSRKA